MKRLIAYWFAAAMTGYVVVVVPLIFIFQPGPIVSLFVGMVVGGLSPIVGLQSKHVQRWTGL